MAIQQRLDRGVRVIVPGGDLSGVGDCEALDSALAAALQEGARLIVVDMDAVHSIRGPAVRTLVLTARKLRRAQGRLVLCRLHASVGRAFAVFSLDRDLDVEGSLGGAMRRMLDLTAAVGPGEEAEAGQPSPESHPVAKPQPPESPATPVAEQVAAAFSGPDPVDALADDVLAALVAAGGRPTAPPTVLPRGREVRPLPDDFAALVVETLAGTSARTLTAR